MRGEIESICRQHRSRDKWIRGVHRVIPREFDLCFRFSRRTQEATPSCAFCSSSPLLSLPPPPRLLSRLLFRIATPLPRPRVPRLTSGKDGLPSPFTMDEPIAIIGLDARFPGEGDTAERFYESLLAGRSARTEVPNERYNADSFWHPDGDRSGSVGAPGDPGI